jgi:hypothetical protein
MRMQPRQELLDIWRAVARASWQKDQWVWGGHVPRNSISDAEQLLCLLLPASQVPVFGIDDPDRTGEDMLTALAPMGGATEIPRKLAAILLEYYTEYEQDGTPVFSGGSYFNPSDEGVPPSPEQARLDIVDSYAMSVTLSLATIGFVKVFRTATKRKATLDQLAELSGRASVRLSAALVGLLRSFSVNVFDADSATGKTLINTVNQENLPAREVAAGLRAELKQTIASFREILIGSGQDPDLDSANRLFECGWSWSIVEGAPAVPTTDDIGVQREGIAEQAPFLYFTTVALDAIEDLFSERTRVLGLLNEEQQRLSRALQLRADLTRSYWATVATFGPGTWPVEDPPWRTTDGESSDYFTLQVTSLAVKGLMVRRGVDAELVRIGRVLTELANRSRLTRRPDKADPAVSLHHPGVPLHLSGSEKVNGERITWVVSEFAPLLLQRTANVAGLLTEARERGALLETTDRVWEHMLQRRLQNTVRNAALWDDPGAAFPGFGLPEQSAPSWYITERVVQALVIAAGVLDRPPLRSLRLAEFAVDLLNEAEQLFDRELMRGSGSGQSLQGQIQAITANLRRARQVLADQPGTAAGLATNVLDQLNDLAAGRQNAKGVI